MQFKDLGKLFNSFDELKYNHANNALSFSELDGIDKKTISGLFKINSSGISEFTMEQTKAKASAMGLTNALTNELIAMSNDADFSAKAATGKLTWGKALEDNKISVADLGRALSESETVSNTAKDALKRLGETGQSTGKDYENLVKNIIEGNNGFENIADTTVDVGEKVSKSTGV